MTKKKIIAILGLLLILVGLGAGLFLMRQQQDIRKKAAPATSVSLKLPTSKTILVNDNFDVTVEVDSSTNILSASELEIIYNKEKLKLSSLTPSTFLPVVLVSPQIGDGTASVTLGSQAANPPQGKGTLATLKFVALAPGNAAVSFGPKTRATGIYETTDVIVSKNPATVTIIATGETAGAPVVSSPRPSPSPSPGASPSPTVTPSPTPGTGGAASPTPSATGKPTVTFPANKTVAAGSVITGTAAPNSTVTITIQSDPITATVKADSTGKWSYTLPSTLSAGTHTITVTDSNGTSTTTFTVSGSQGKVSTPSGQTPEAGFGLPTVVAALAGLLLIFAGSLFALR